MFGGLPLYFSLIEMGKRVHLAQWFDEVRGESIPIWMLGCLREELAQFSGDNIAAFIALLGDTQTRYDAFNRYVNAGKFPHKCPRQPLPPY